jgi:hypothetical protein
MRFSIRTDPPNSVTLKQAVRQETDIPLNDYLYSKTSAPNEPCSTVHRRLQPGCWDVHCFAVRLSNREKLSSSPSSCNKLDAYW